MQGRVAGVVGLLGAALFAGAVQATTQAVAEDCAAQAAVGSVAFADIDPARAVPLCERAVAADPEDADLQAHLCRALVRAERVDEALAWCERSAAAGSAAGEFGLGNAFHNAIGVTRNDEEAMRWWRRAANQGLAAAQLNLAFGYETGGGVEEDVERALRWYSRAAEQGHAEAQYRLGRLYDDGWGVALPADLPALERHGVAASRGDADAQYALGLVYLLVGRSRVDAARGLNWMRRAADQGHAGAQWELGDLHQRGDGVEQDDVLAAELFRAAAEQGHAGAQTALGQAYASGRGVDEDEERARYWLRRALLSLTPTWQRETDEAWYQRAINMEVSDKEVALWLLERPGAGFAAAIWRTSGMISDGGDPLVAALFERAAWYQLLGGDAVEWRYANAVRGGGDDYERLVSEPLAAAEAGEVWAQEHVGWMYLYGLGLEHDENEARRWLLAAAERSYTPAMRYLSLMQQERERLLFWVDRAAELDDALAQYTRALIHLEQVDVITQYTDDGRKLREHGGDADALRAAKVRLRQAAERGLPQAQDTLARLYSLGGDYLQAEYWYQQAWEQLLGDRRGGLVRFYGRGHSEWLSGQARHWYERAAAQGHTDAMQMLESR
ncbi:TPR repeat protein [Natronocella acetinitrilica]|uniref:TPR repeat protein n=1 Tax=Natronocella acetinitrilica TaxID=414046 RepID=A0AAE3G3C3_9GAMM|nr:tetratricopeptide repeat protein [Natronocella acetinitrilica]MCP1674294.1 TPR repeat protein [Natronocella acetinitrilica]